MKDLLRSGPLLQLGWILATATLIPLGLGLALDRHLHTAPLFTLVGALIGIVGGSIGIVRTATRVIEDLGKAGDTNTEEALGARDAKEDST